MANAIQTIGRLAARAGFGRALSGTLRERLVQPLILFSADEDERRPIAGLPGQYYLSVTESVREARAAARAGIAGILVFAAPDRRDETALIATQRDWLVPRAIGAIKDALPDLGVAADVCVCAYTAHGQCALFAEGHADVSSTRDRLAEIAATFAEAGADLLLSSGMVPGSVRAVRGAVSAARDDVAVGAALTLSSALYAPYRSAVGIPAGERAVPLLDQGDLEGALARAATDVAEGADLVVVKPGVSALDVVTALHARVSAPVASFHVAGEHVLLRTAAEQGMLDETALLPELARATRRAGADLLFTYGALETAELLENGS